MSDEKQAETLAEGTLMSHLLELRNRLLKAVIALLVTFIPCAYFANDLFTLIARPLIDKLLPVHPPLAANTSPMRRTSRPPRSVIASAATSRCPPAMRNSTSPAEGLGTARIAPGRASGPGSTPSAGSGRTWTPLIPDCVFDCWSPEWSPIFPVVTVTVWRAWVSSGA